MESGPGAVSCAPFLTDRTLAYYELLHEAVLSPDGTELQLSSKSPLQWGASLGGKTTTFVRSCYRTLYEMLAHGPEPYHYLAGTSGVGKSCFGFYALWRALHDEKCFSKVVYLPFCYDRAFVFTVNHEGKRTVRKMDIFAALDGCKSDQSLVICDSQLIRIPTCRTIAISSPCYELELLKKFESSQAELKEWVMPPFSLPEMLACRAACFPELSKRQVADNYLRWGGSARSVLKKAHKQARLMKAFRTTLTLPGTWDALQADADDVSPRTLQGKPCELLHLHVAEEGDDAYRYQLDQARLCFASTWVKALCIWRFLEVKPVQDIAKLFTAPTFSAKGASLRSELFELIAFPRLCKATEDAPYEMWPLIERAGPPIKNQESSLSGRPCFHFHTIDELAAEWNSRPEMLGRPLEPNWPSWDAVSMDGDILTFWRVTVSLLVKHKLSASGEGFELAAGLLTRCKRARLVWVVPQALVDEAVHQGPVALKCAFLLDQYVVGVSTAASDLSAGLPDACIDATALSHAISLMPDEDEEGCSAGVPVSASTHAIAGPH